MIDPTDSHLLAELQRDPMQTAQDLGGRVNLSASQAARRRQRLEQDGVITGYMARLDPAKVGLTVQAFVQVQMSAHSSDAARSFASLITTLPQVTSCWTMTGEADYLLAVWCADLPALNLLIQQRLLAHPAVARVQSQIVMDRIKDNAALPI